MGSLEDTDHWTAPHGPELRGGLRLCQHMHTRDATHLTRVDRRRRHVKLDFDGGLHSTCLLLLFLSWLSFG